MPYFLPSFVSINLDVEPVTQTLTQTQTATAFVVGPVNGAVVASNSASAGISNIK